MDVFDAIAAGRVSPPPPARTLDAGAPADAELDISYRLARHVPDMERGFTIHTNYGEMSITGPLAQRIQKMVRNALIQELDALGSHRK